jgi:hypothetical protein
MSDDLAGASPVQRLVRRPVPEREAATTLMRSMLARAALEKKPE